MLLRNASIMITLFMCLSQNFLTQDFYDNSEGEIPLGISTQRILGQFNSNLNAEEKFQILSKQKNYLNLESIQHLPVPRVSILGLKDISSSGAVNVLLQFLRLEEVDYANDFLTQSDTTASGATNKILLRLKSANQFSLLDQIIYDFQGVTSYTRSLDDELLIEIKVHKSRNALALANEIHETEIFDYCEPDFVRFIVEE